MQRQTLAILLVALTSAGCALMPPKRIPVDRLDYLEAINTSWKEQLLNNLVMLRYGDSMTFLELKEVTTNYTLETGANAGYSYGLNYQAAQSAGSFIWSPTTNQNNASAGANIRYSRSPSIKYAPIRGKNLRETMMDPIPLDAVLKSLQAGRGAGYILPLTVESVNNLRNRSVEGNFGGDDDFFQFVCLFDELRIQGIIRINLGEKREEKDSNPPKGNPTAKPEKDTNPKVAGKAVKSKTKTSKDKTPKTGTTETVNIPDYIILDETRAKLPDLKKKLESFKNLLGLAPKINKIKISYGNRTNQPIKDGDNIIGEIVIQTRSVLQLLTLLSKFIDVPAEHIPNNQYRAIKSELVKKPLNCKELSDNKILFCIENNKERPQDAYVAINYRKHWFYIDDNDYHSKNIFSSTVLLLAMSEPGN